MSARRAPFPIKSSARKRPYVKVTSKTYFVEVLLDLFPQQVGRQAGRQAGWHAGKWAGRQDGRQGKRIEVREAGK